MMNPSSNVIGTCLTILCVRIAVDGFTLGDRKEMDNDHYPTEIKRSVLIDRTLVGPLAARKLLKDTKPIRCRKPGCRVYKKWGNYQQALEDFKSFNPKHVAKGYNGKMGIELVGYVGDKQLVLKEVGTHSKGKPTLEVQGVGSTEKIIYSDDWSEYFKPSNN